ncbi:phosphogluconate dehydratase [Vibrio hangzhouensis]|uniref:Phosphogluconate dehydratase n=1 Tax=Vibrio hangzhouensis TaxID=462991 RepID=A0A1H5ZK88_9VIBR|nr:phosphogluconate dehydratase [Vibrio hangzhouensis]SEG36510.1 6-phosphogluconate dehydratase [Vibrio hangzhouensis]
MTINSVITKVAQNIVQRSEQSRKTYLENLEHSANKGKLRASLSCGNLAHTVAASTKAEKVSLLDFTKANLAIVSSYNDMVSAHQPYLYYPELIKKALAELGNTAQVAGGVPAMCDGITQGNDGMELSLFSRDLIAQSTALSLSHNTFDGTLLLGVCDKIAPGQLMGALTFGHLPTMFVPSGPMASGISNDEKVSTRQKYVAGEVDKRALLEVECKAYHSAGTCTFFGTANTNQLVFEAMGLMLPGSAFVAPNTLLRDKLTEKAAQYLASVSVNQHSKKAVGHVVNEKSVVNGLVALLAAGGSTNHTIHLVAVAKAAGWIVTWDDLDELSRVVPLLVNMYPNGDADINAFHKAGGVPALMKNLSLRGLIFMDANPAYGTMEDYLTSPYLDAVGQVRFAPAMESSDTKVLADSRGSFSETGGLKLLSGNLGRGVMKVSAVAEEHQKVTAPALVFESQHDVEIAYKNGLIKDDAVIVVRFNGPAANGMPELHKLMPILGNLMKQGLKVALVTDGRLSGASGKVPAVIHMTPEAKRGGPLAQIQNGDMIEIDGQTGKVSVLNNIEHRLIAESNLSNSQRGSGRELFGVFRHLISSAEQGATLF